MRKLAFLFVAMVAVSFASCGGSTKSNADAEAAKADSIRIADSIAAVEAAAAADTMVVDSAAAEVN